MFLDTFAKLGDATISFAKSVRPLAATQLPLERFSWHLIFDGLSRIWRENSSFN